MKTNEFTHPETGVFWKSIYDPTIQAIKDRKYKKIKYINFYYGKYKGHKLKHLPIKSKKMLTIHAIHKYEYLFDLEESPYPVWFLKKREEHEHKEMKRIDNIIKKQKEKELKNKLKSKIECCICLNTKRGRDMSWSISCSHSVCLRCYSDALHAGKPIIKCPLCRAVFTNNFELQ
jgi:hypothetical protein